MTLPHVPLAHLGGSPLNFMFTTAALALSLGLGYVAVSRLQDRGFAGLSTRAGWALAALALASFVLSIAMPPIGPQPSKARPATAARLEILSPRPGEVLHGDPAYLDVRVRVDGGRIVPFTSRLLTSDEGHLHVFIDGELEAMTAGLDSRIQIDRTGDHQLEIQFVAVDHAPFDPPVLANVTFDVER
ncbi:MAG: hypothetical protein E6G44_04290 [Actinobacteria bacterium]|nr:MAG: hypothetical protein E6G44_04290 [Actinomycetota bacterium]